MRAISSCLHVGSLRLLVEAVFRRYVTLLSLELYNVVLRVVIMRGLIRCALVGVVFGCVGVLGVDGSSAWGSSLNLVPQNPDVAALSLTADYQPSTGSIGTLTVTGWPTGITMPGTNVTDPIDNGTYNLTAEINKANGQPVSGTLDIGGTVAGSASSGTLLTGQLSQFGFQNSGGDIFEFIFNVTGGDLAKDFNSQSGVILTATGSGFDGSFTTGFATQVSESVSDTFPVVPEPTSSTLLFCALVVGLPAFVCNRKRRA